MPATDPVITQVRRFHRTVTQRAGALDDHFLARGRTLGASRVLWEIGIEGCEVRALRSRLDIDSGQLSRTLRALEADGLARTSPSAADARVRVARLTAAGLAERALLDDRSDEAAAAILAPLDADRRAELVAAMRTVERLITDSVVEIRVVDPAGDDAQRCLRAYFAELRRRSELRFDPTKGTSAEPHELRPPAGAFLVVYLRGEPVGCGAVKHHPDGPSDIKRMWIAESARGLGLARRLLARLEALAAERAATAVRLDTNRALTEAIAMYRSSGYVEIDPFNDEPFAHHWFQKRLD
ncbi:MAG TPA: MarR family winged helix-turn-helix transcriptional regulator [Solirubrobacteraceae bacterium]|jgi:DNA-binding MarR family transcriptional regulator|nr:MarR family winged helix-turn-helix transcriptional regulator [Solirubrobacteraceae bacterium]